jgi:uncharacterized protein (TIGR00369 family)
MKPPAAAQQIQFGIVPTEVAKLLSGYELLRGILEGVFPAPPITKVFNFRLSGVVVGQVAFTGQPAFDYYNPIGSVHGGFAATLLDSCMGCAVHSTLKAGMGYTTLEIKVNFVRPMSETTGPVQAEGKVISSGKRIATAEGRIVDAQGKLYAHATTTCLIFPL